MASGGSVSLGSKPNITFTVSYSVTRNLANVSISLSVSVSGVSGASYYGYPLYGRPTVNGSQKSTYTLKESSPSQWSAFSVSLGTHSTTVSNLSQTSMPVSVYFTGNGKSATLSFSATLPSVAPDEISSSVDFVVGNDLPIEYITKDRNFDHAVKVMFNGTQIFYSPFRDSVIVVPLAGLADQMYQMVTDANTAPVSVTLETYRVTSENPYSTQLIGSNTRTGTASFSASDCMPTFTDFSVSNNDRNLTGDNMTIVPGHSTLTLTMGAASGNKSATMASFFATCGDKSASCPYSSGATLTLQNVNSNTVSVQAVDSRGNSTTVSKTLTVLDYTVPQFGSVQLKRDNAIDDTVKLIYSGKWWNESFGYMPNSITYAGWRYKLSGAESWTNGTTVITPTVSGDTFSFEGYITPVSGTWNTDNSYEIVLDLDDRLGTAHILGTINVGVPGIDVRRVGSTYYAGFGKVPAVADMPNGGIDVAGDYFQNGSPLFPLGIPNGGTGAGDALGAVSALLAGVSQNNGYVTFKGVSYNPTKKTFTASGDGLIFAGATCWCDSTNSYGSTSAIVRFGTSIYACDYERTDVSSGANVSVNASACFKISDGQSFTCEAFSSKGGTKYLYWNVVAFGCTVTMS